MTAALYTRIRLSVFAVLSFLMLPAILPHADAQAWQWAREGSGTVCEGWAAATDPSGNVFGAGETGLAGVLHFGSMTDTVAIWQAAWVKYSSSGTPLWSGFTTGDGVSLNNISSDPSGNFIVYGVMTGVTMNVGGHTLVNPAVATHLSDQKYFIAKMDASGSLLWAINDGSNIAYDDHMSGISDPPVIISNGGIATDNAGDIYVTGYFHDSATIGTHTLRTAGNIDVFIAKYSPSGTLLWVRSVGGSGKDVATNLAVTPAGTVFVCGYTYSSSFTVGPSSVTNPHIPSPQAFVAEFSPGGAPLWADAAGGPLGAFPMGLAVDNYNNLYMTGGFSDATISFGSATGTRNFPSAPLLASFLVQYSPSGTATWVKTIDAKHRDVWGYCIAISSCGQVWVSGNYSDTAKLDTISLPIYPLTSSDPLYIAGYSLTGNLVGYSTLATGGDDQNGIACDATGNVFVCGDMEGTLIAGDTLPGGGENIYVAKYTIALADTVYKHSDTTMCSAGADSITLHAPGGYTYYYWNNGSTDSVQTFYSPGTHWVYCVACGQPVVIDTIHINANGLIDTIRHRYDSSICLFGDNPAPVILTAPSGGNSYTWYNGDTGIADTERYAGAYWVSYYVNCTFHIDTFVLQFRPQPAPITGRSWICLSDSVLLTDATPGGTWSSSNTSIAAVDAASGIVAGNAPGLDTITYAFTNGCYVTQAESVLAPPCINAVNAPPAAAPQVEIYPIPAKNQLTVKLGSNAFNSITITDVAGRELISQNISTKLVYIDISRLSSGLYYIALRGSDGMLVRKFVKE